MRVLRQVVLASAMAMCVAGGGAALAGDAEAEALYGRYHQAIEAAKLCRDMSFDQDAHSRMATVIHAKIDHKIGAKRLKLLTAAQRDAQALVNAEGCDGAGPSELLALFDADLAPALQ